MCGPDGCTPEHTAYLMHIMGCRGCYAPVSNYCEEGARLRLEYDARFIAGLDGLEERRRFLGYMKANMPDRIAELERLVKQKYTELRG